MEGVVGVAEGNVSVINTDTQATSMHSCCFLIVVALSSLLTTEIRATEVWSSEEKEACTILVKEYSSTIEPEFKNDAEKQYWHKLLLTDEAIHFSRVSFSKYNNEIAPWLVWRRPPIYQSMNAPLDKDDLWRIEIKEPHPMSSDSDTLVIFISTDSKEIMTAWEMPGG